MSTLPAEATSEPALSENAIEAFHRDGYVVLRGAIPDTECDRLAGAIARRLEGGGHTISVPPDKVFPEPAKYTLAANDWADPDIAFIAEHPTVLDAVETVLDAPPSLTAFVAYTRSPDDAGTAAHCDHKRWRPVGSSLKWCFTIIPLVDFDETTGPLLVSPGSHRLIESVQAPGERTWSATPPDREQLAPFVDPELRRGDLLLLHGNCWHEAPANRSDRLRIGIFNKYAARNAPPAVGYFKWSEAVHDVLGARGRELLAVHDDRTIACARLVLEREGEGGPELLLRGSDADGWTLPGGPVDTERNRALEVGLHGAWDVGSRIAALEDVLDEQLGLAPTWMTYLGDYEEGDGLCRVYASVWPADAEPPSLPGDTRWVAVSEIDTIGTSCPFIGDALDRWRDETVVRAKGKAEHRCVPPASANQFVD